MKSKFLLPLVLLGGLTLVGCGNQPAPVGPVVTTTVTISNKTALQAEWHVGDAGRELSLTLDPDGNIMQLIADGDLTTTSSNNSVVGVSGVGLSALGAGTATVTVNYKGATDTVEITVSAKQTAKEKYGVAHEGTAEDPFTNEDALTVAAHADYNSEDYYVRGEVASFYHAPGSRTDGYVSWFLKPAEGQTAKFEVYKCKKADGSALTDADIWVGAIATAHGTFTVYQGQYETSEGSTFVKSEGEPPAPRTTIQSTFAEVLAAGKALPDGGDTYDYHEFTGFVTKKEGNNYFLTATKGEAISDVKTNTFEIYNPAAAVSAKLLKDAEVKVKAVVKNYHDQIENGNTLVADDVTVITAGTPWESIKATVTEARTLIAAVPAPAVSEFDSSKSKPSLSKNVNNGATYEVTGIVTKKGNTWTEESQYKNADFYIADTAGDETNTLQVFRYADKTIFDGLQIGDTVKVTCTLVAYFTLNKDTSEVTLAAYETNANPTVVNEGQGGGGQQNNVLYKLDGTQVQTDNDAHDGSNYAKSLPVTQNGVQWDVFANTTMNPWRLGGKSITDTDRLVNSKAPVTTAEVAKVVVEIGAIDTAVFNSATLKVGTTEGASDVSEIQLTTGLTQNTSLNFVKPEGATWANRYFTFVFNITVSGSKNKYVQLVGISFLATAE